VRTSLFCPSLLSEQRASPQPFRPWYGFGFSQRSELSRGCWPPLQVGAQLCRKDPRGAPSCRVSSGSSFGGVDSMLAHASRNLKDARNEFDRISRFRNSVPDIGSRPPASSKPPPRVTGAPALPMLGMKISPTALDSHSVPASPSPIAAWSLRRSRGATRLDCKWRGDTDSAVPYELGRRG